MELENPVVEVEVEDADGTVRKVTMSWREYQKTARQLQRMINSCRVLPDIDITANQQCITVKNEN